MTIPADVKDRIDKMSHEELCVLWRFAPLSDDRFQGEAGQYTKERLFNHFGGFTPEISKKIGWE